MTSQSDYDSPWKDVLDLFFEDCVEFFFPQAHAQIDWLRGFEFLLSGYIDFWTGS